MSSDLEILEKLENSAATLPTQSSVLSQHSSAAHQFWRGVRAVMPLALAVLPWGLLAGSLAVQVGLNAIQAMAMSVVIFAGAAQLLTLNMVQEGQGVAAILLSVFILTSQHLLYGLKFRSYARDLPFGKRLILGFLLTDELFAVGVQHQRPDFAYLFGAGLGFYLAWCLFSLAGVIMAYQLPQLTHWHLDFSIAALFILLLVPLIRTRAVAIGIAVTLLGIVLCCYVQQTQSMILAALFGMLVSALLDRDTGEWQ